MSIDCHPMICRRLNYSVKVEPPPGWKEIGRRAFSPTASPTAPMAVALILITAFLAMQASAADEASSRLAEAQQMANRGESRRAEELATQALKLDPQLTDAHYWRGRERFRLGEFDRSVADFDAVVRQRPAQAPALWERGIACYYSGQFRKGAAQFSAYQNVDNSDVENAVWHFLCLSQLEGLPAARRQMMSIGRDARIPMQTIYELYHGDATPADVLRSVEQAELTEGQRHAARFYAHLYLGLYFDVASQPAEARRHLPAAVKDYRVEHYMWDVARVHAARWTDKDRRQR